MKLLSQEIMTVEAVVGEFHWLLRVLINIQFTFFYAESICLLHKLYTVPVKLNLIFTISLQLIFLGVKSQSHFFRVHTQCNHKQVGSNLKLCYAVNTNYW